MHGRKSWERGTWGGGGRGCEGRCSADLREQAAGSWRHRRPFRPLCSAPSPAPFALAELSHSSSSPSPARLPAATVAGLVAPTPASAHRTLPSGAAAPGEKGSRRARRPRRRTSWAPRPRPSLASAARAWHLGLSPTPRPRPPGSEPPGWVPQVPVPQLHPPRAPSARQTLPCGPPLSPPSLPARRRSPAPSWRRSWRPPLATRHSPGGRGAAPAPAASRAVRVPAPRLRALARSVLA